VTVPIEAAIEKQTRCRLNNIGHRAAILCLAAFV
jgi:hypothetical protein